MDSEEDIKSIDAGLSRLQRELLRINEEMTRLKSLRKKILNKRPASELDVDDANSQPPAKLYRRCSQLNLDLQAVEEVCAEDLLEETDKILTEKTTEEGNPVPEEGEKQEENKSDWKDVQNKKKRVPPIFVYNVSDWLSLAGMIKLVCESECPAENGPEFIKLKPKTPKDYGTITSMLEKERVEFHTFHLGQKNEIKVVIKNIPANIPPAAVKEDLLGQGFNILNTSQLKDKFQTPLPFYLVTLEKEGGSRIYELKSCCYVKVKVERYKKKKGELTQCYNCQRLGHTSLVCKALPKCVKCAGDHRTGDCKKKDMLKPAACINCGGTHPASYKGCPYYIKHKNEALVSKFKKAPEAKKMVEKPLIFTPRMTYAQKLRGKSENENKNNDKTPHDGKSEDFRKLEKRVDDMMAILKEISVNIKHAKNT